MRILVTGGTGQIGAALVPRLAGLGTVVAPNRSELDLTHPAEIAEQLDRISPHLIINCAAYTNVDKAEDERDLAFTVNAESPGVIARWAAAHRVPLVHLSTDYVFDGSGERPWREDDPTGPLSAYGASKLAGEKSVQAALGPHLIVRTSWIYAAEGRNFLRTIASLAAQRSELRVVADQVGAPTSAAVVANGLVQILGAPIDDLPARFAAARGLVHLAAGRRRQAGTVLRWPSCKGSKRAASAVKAERVIPIPTDEYPSKAIRPRNSRLDLQRLSQVFGITPLHWTAALEIELDQLVGKRPPFLSKRAELGFDRCPWRFENYTRGPVLSAHRCFWVTAFALKSANDNDLGVRTSTTEHVDQVHDKSCRCDRLGPAAAILRPWSREIGNTARD